MNVAPEYKLRVTNLEGKMEYHYIRPTPRVITEDLSQAKPPGPNSQKKGTIEY